WFGDSAALGKAILVKQWMLDPGQTYRITGVVRIPPGPTTIPFDGIFDSGENEARAEHESVHGAELYLLLAGGTSADRVTREADRIYTQGLAEALPEGSSFLNDFQKSSLSSFIRSGNRFGLRLLPFENLHLHPPSGPSPMQKILSLTLLALMLLWIGISNYTNLAIVQAMTRAREIGVRKVLGARRTQIALQILVESFCQCSAALFLGLILVELLLPWFNGAFGTSISLWYSQSPGTLMIQLLAILLGTTLLAGAYPALVISGYASSRVLKGNFSRSREGALVRQILILLQFGISVVFFTGLVIVNRQVHFLEHRDPGFSAVGLINLSDIRDSAVEERIRRIPGVIAVGPSTQVMGSSMEFQIPVRYQGRQVSLSQSSVGLQSLQALNVHLISGRLFSDQSGQDKYNSVVVNQSAARALGGDVIGQTIMENDTVAQQIIGVIGDYQFEGFNQPILPTLYAVNHRGPSSNMPNLLVRYNPLQERRVIASIRTIWKSVHPGYLIHYNFLTKQYAKLLQDDTRFLHIIQTFTGLSILLSLMGIFALSAFTAGERSREIGVRRVMGATVTDILRLLNRDFVLLVALANLAGWPVAFLLGRQWLNGFVFRIAMPLYAFFWAGVLTLLVTILTVTFQAYHTAAANPAQTLRHE
ncbi:MAG TPA: FtsX-like permease family protein, partial [Chitinophagaceae bacterium]|nr:FtsX-like permease family protein [Chitinophagaceae bacterium]